MNNRRKGKKIQRLREHHDIKQADMAKSLGISQSRYSELESGAVDISDERTEQIAKLLKTTPEFLNSPDDVELVMNHNHGNNGYNVIQNVQQHMVGQDFMQQITDQLGQVIKDQSELLKETQKDRARMLEMLDYWSKNKARGK